MKKDDINAMERYDKWSKSRDKTIENFIDGKK